MRAARLAYTPEALSDIDEIRAHLRREAGGRVAARMAERIRLCVQRARETPAAGAPRPEYRPNCRFVTVRPFVIYYDFDGASFVVLRVLHRARDRDRIMSKA